MRARSEYLVAWLAVVGLATAACGQDAWTHRGNTSARNSVATAGTPPDITAPRFVTTDSRPLVGQSSPVVADHRIFVYAENAAGDGNEVLAFSETDGRFLWACPVEPAEWNSRSSPTVDLARGHVLIGSGANVTAIDVATGEVAWDTSLGGLPIVNSTVCVEGDLAYVATYFPYAAGGRLWAINLDPDHPTLDAGDVYWSRGLDKSLGNEASWHGGSSTIVATDYDGYLLQFSQYSAPGWTFEIPGAGGWLPTYGSFTGGVAIEGNRAYAATYDYYGGEDNSRLFCVNMSSGLQAWDAPSERTSTIPVVTDSLVILSGGIDGYGSVPKVEAFNKTTGTKLWQWTGGGLWTCQPVVVGNTLYVGAKTAGDDFDACTDLYALDLTKQPEDLGFVAGHFVGAGGSPAYANGNLYTIGAAGLHAFGPPVGAEPLVISAELDHDWVYQNTAATTQDRHHSTLTVTIQSGEIAGETYVVSVGQGGGTLADFTTQATDNPLVVEVVGGRTDSSLPSAPVWYVLDVTLTGQQSGRTSNTVAVDLMLCAIGDVTGDGTINAVDKAHMNAWLNAMGLPGDTVRHLDLTGDGNVNAVDKVQINRQLNALGIL